MALEFLANPVSEGIAIGEAFHYIPYTPVVEEGTVCETLVEQTILEYVHARDAAKKELDQIFTKISESDPDKAKIFTAHIDILFDAAMDEDIRDEITYDFFTPAWAISKVFDKYTKIIGKSKDPLIRERTADMQDVKFRLLRCLEGLEEKNLETLDKPVIVIAGDLLPSDTATLDRTKVLAIVTEVGGATSHSAIIARSYEIPALLGLKDAMSIIPQQGTIIVDAVNGRLIVDPTANDILRYKDLAESFEQKRIQTKQFIGADPITSDGVHIEVELNIGSADVVELAGSKYTDGVGLFRTEFIYMGKPQLPTEEEQLAIYKKVLLEYGDRPVTIRTLDIGGDKKLDCMELPVEDNPFLGNRALRLCFDKPEVFRTQLRACLRASVFGNLWLMFPMVASMDDIYKAKAALDSARAELDAEDIPYSHTMKVGVMIEIPAIAVIADMVANEVDFVSIGTNDLTQYTTAVDRMNPAVAQYYQSFHPAIFRLMGYVITAFNDAGKSVCVCGELGGDKLAAPVLIGLGMRKLSMGIASVPQIKKILSGLTIPKAEELARTVVKMKTAKEIEAYLKEELEPLF